MIISLVVVVILAVLDMVDRFSDVTVTISITKPKNGVSTEAKGNPVGRKVARYGGGTRV